MKAEAFNPQVAFVGLHAALSHQPELVDLHESGTPLHLLLSLYPLNAETYLPYLQVRFATRERQKLHNFWMVDGSVSPYTWDLRDLLDDCTPESSHYYSDADLGPDVFAFIERYVDRADPTSWNRSNLTFEVTNVLDVASRLLHLDLERYFRMPRHRRAFLQKALQALPERFRAYEAGLDTKVLPA